MSKAKKVGIAAIAIGSWLMLGKIITAIAGLIVYGLIGVGVLLVLANWFRQDRG